MKKQESELTYSQAAIYLGVSTGKARMLVLGGAIVESAPNRIAKAEIDRYLHEMAELYRKQQRKVS